MHLKRPLTIWFLLVSSPIAMAQTVISPGPLDSSKFLKANKICADYKKDPSLYACCLKDKDHKLSLYEKLFKCPSEKPRISTAGPNSDSIRIYDGTITPIPCPREYSDPEIVARYSSSISAASLAADRNGHVYFIDDAQRIVRIPDEGWEPIDLSDYKVGERARYMRHIVRHENSFYFIGRPVGEPPYRDHLYRQDLETRTATDLLNTRITGMAPSFYWLGDIAIHGEDLYFTHTGPSQTMSTTGPKIRKIGLGSLPVIVDDADVIGEGSLAWEPIIVDGTGTYYLSEDIREEIYAPDAVRMITHTGLDVPVLGRGDLRPLPGDPPVDALSVDTTNLYGDIALNSCGSLAVSDRNYGRIYMKTRDSDEAFSIYAMGGPERGPKMPFALAFDSNDTLYAVMCQGPGLTSGPCEVVKFTPITSTD